MRRLFRLAFVAFLFNIHRFRPIIFYVGFLEKSLTFFLKMFIIIM